MARHQSEQTVAIAQGAFYLGKTRIERRGEFA
jgi:hypothetical protein